jgi:hypothetical protein
MRQARSLSLKSARAREGLEDPDLLENGFDALGRLEEKFDPRGRKTLYLYNRNGNQEGTILGWLGHGLPSKIELEKGYDQLDVC